MASDRKSGTVALISPLVRNRIQCVGKHHMTYHRTRLNDGQGLLHSKISSTKMSDQDLNILIDIEFLRSLDPKEWKDQDHYAVLGLKEQRFHASEEDIKRAYRKIVLKHHPDKRKAQGEEINAEDDYFTCITRAYEILGNTTKRRSYDSIDHEFDDNLPTSSEIKEHYFEIFNIYFDLNARWSEKKKMPKFGDEKAERKDVENFYNCWYNFESWREYSYLDEEDKEKGQDRDERRWIEKQNKVIRQKRKKEEMSRIRSLVDLAYNNDPRIAKFKQEEKDKKLAAKMAKLSVAQAQKAEEDRMLREAQLLKQKADEAEQKRIELIRIEKEQLKRALKKERKTLRDAAKSNNYYTTDDKEKIKHMEGVEKICEMLKTLELQEFNKLLVAGGRDVFVNTLLDVETKLEEERRALFSHVKTPSSTNSNSNSTIKAVEKAAIWTPENMQVLIKAVNLFPAGTPSRWDVIANYLNQHGTVLNGRQFIARDVLNKAKDLQSSDFSKNSLKSQANEHAFQSFEKNKKELKIIDREDISVNDEQVSSKKMNGVVSKSKEATPEPVKKPEEKQSPQEEPQPVIPPAESKTEKSVPVPNHKAQSPPPSVKPVTTPAPVAPASTEDASRSWTKDEQALLEQAIKTYPISTPDRWDRIAECIPNRTKKECLRRVKELVDHVNAKKKAQQSVK